MSIDPRLIERRRVVAEDRAHRNVGRLLKVLAAVALAGLVVWALLSPWLSVSQVRTSGVEASATYEILAEHGVSAGRPMIFLLGTGAVEAALSRDPWVVEARVVLNWPDEVAVGVVEREPRLWVESDDGWVLVSDDGQIVPGPETPDGLYGQLEMPELGAEDLEGGDLVLGAGEFLDALPLDLAPMVEMRLESGEMWATVQGFEVRLGRPVEMREKALALVGLLQQDIAAGSILVMVAPTHPAVESSTNSEEQVDEGGIDDTQEESTDATPVSGP